MQFRSHICIQSEVSQCETGAGRSKYELCSHLELLAYTSGLRLPAFLRVRSEALLRKTALRAPAFLRVRLEKYFVVELKLFYYICAIEFANELMHCTT